MSGLYFLTFEDFHLQKFPQGDMVCTKFQGFSLVLFYSTRCEYCKEFIPVFRKLPSLMEGCFFGMMNIDTNRQYLEMSKNSITPIKYVPYVVLYMDGRPILAYQGASDAMEIRRFITDVANNMKKKQGFTKGGGKAIPITGQKELTELEKYYGDIGKPVCGGKDQMVCYINFAEYDNMRGKPGGGGASTGGSSGMAGSGRENMSMGKIHG
jgi:thiol-disulfide isomerase/thioredoxin